MVVFCVTVPSGHLGVTPLAMSATAKTSFTASGCQASSHVLISFNSSVCSCVLLPGHAKLFKYACAFLTSSSAFSLLLTQFPPRLLSPFLLPPLLWSPQSHHVDHLSCFPKSPVEALVVSMGHFDSKDRHRLFLAKHPFPRCL